ncbi:MAG: TatD family hydrolase [Bacteroidales bacterium]|jgi:TatD DNase family protein|nr:TatD family hydrolase [Bacteroidales bacterium]
MQFIDTHSHIYLEEYQSDRKKVIENSLKSGVCQLFLPNINLESIEPMLAVCRQYPTVCYPMLGLHPCDVKEDYKDILKLMFQQFDNHRFIAIGEVGIDLYWDKTFLQFQKDALRYQIEFALGKNLPIIIHKRQSYYEVMSVLDEFKGCSLKGIFHCYSGSVEHAKEVIERGFLLGIGGTVTYKSSKLDEILPSVALSDIVLETDSPFLTPAPYRGQRNSSAYIPIIAEKIAQIMQSQIEVIARKTTENAIKLFNLNL